jgi:purine-binding chemotaxis protein CheW
MKQASINRDDVRKRLQASEDSLREALSESPERIKTVFRQRAVQLAKLHAANKPVSRGIPALIFRLAQERYAIALQELAEVLPFHGCTQVPGGSLEFLGVISLRGELRPVVDLARVLSGRAPTQSGSDSGAVLVLRRPIAMKVDEIEELREIRSEELARSVQGQYLQALASGTLGLLDVETMLSAVFSPKEHQPK